MFQKYHKVNLQITVGTQKQTMLKSILRGLYRHKSSLASENCITTIKSVNSYRITLSDPKTRYVNILIKINYHDISISFCVAPPLDDFLANYLQQNKHFL